MCLACSNCVEVGDGKLNFLQKYQFSNEILLNNNVEEQNEEGEEEEEIKSNGIYLGELYSRGRYLYQNWLDLLTDADLNLWREVNKDLHTFIDNNFTNREEVEENSEIITTGGGGVMSNNNEIIQEEEEMEDNVLPVSSTEMKMQNSNSSSEISMNYTDNETIEDLEQRIKVAILEKNMPFAIKLSMELMVRKSLENAKKNHRLSVGVVDVSEAFSSMKNM